MPFGRRTLLLASVAVTAALAGCGSENPRLIPEERAQRLTASVERAGRASARGDCDGAQRAVTDARTQVQALPQRVDDRLRRNLGDWLGHVSERIPEDCEPADATPTPTPTSTVPPEVTATPTPTVAPTETPTPEPEETPTPTPAPEVPPPETPAPEGEEPGEDSGVPDGGDDGGTPATP